MKDALKSGKVCYPFYELNCTSIKNISHKIIVQVSIVSTWIFDDFKAVVLEDIGFPPVSDINLKVDFFKKKVVIPFMGVTDYLSLSYLFWGFPNL